MTRARNVHHIRRHRRLRQDDPAQSAGRDAPRTGENRRRDEGAGRHAAGRPHPGHPPRQRLGHRSGRGALPLRRVAPAERDGRHPPRAGARRGRALRPLHRLDARVPRLRTPAHARQAARAERLGHRLDAARPRAHIRHRRGDGADARAVAELRRGRGRGALRARGPPLSSPRARGISRPRSGRAAALRRRRRGRNGGRGLQTNDGRAGAAAAMSDKASLLLDTARRGELHHAIILYGPSPDARRALALRLAQTLNCLNGTAGDGCASCQRIERRTHPDVHWSEVGADKKMISVEQVRDIVAAATLRPYEGRNKVFIVDPAEALSVGGSNSLLKTLEEPPRDTIFILLTRAYDLLLPTIKSRSQPIYIGGDEPRDEELASSIAKALQRYGETRDGAMLLALASLITSHEQPNNAIALLGDALCDAVAGKIDVEIPRERLLAAADACVGAIRWLGVNADVRL